MDGNKNKNEQYGKHIGSVGNINRLWSWIIIDEMISKGVTQFFVSPGMRNAPLLWAVNTHPKANFKTAIDERASAYMALGYAKKAERPACLICTSGTALANYFPAVCEASKSQTPMVILSADRPLEMVTFNANQTMEQNNFYHSFSKGFLNPGTPTEEISPLALRKAINQLITKSVFPMGGPVHINLPFREPLDGTPGNISKDYILKSINENSRLSEWNLPLRAKANDDILAATLIKIKDAKNGLIVIGELAPSVANDKIRNFIKKLNWPVYLDINSNLKFEYSLEDQVTPTFDHPEVFDYFKKKSPDVIIQIGARLVSKHFYNFLKLPNDGFRITIREGSDLEDPSYSRNIRVQTSPDIFCDQILDSLKDETLIKNPALLPWSEVAKKKIKIIDNSELCYPSLSKNLMEIIPEHTTLYLANSTAIRSFDSYCSLKNKKRLHIQSHRGVSGIEGFMAAAAGHTYASDERVTLVIGDISFLHDLNSLILLKETPIPIIVLVVNNGGGGIFSLLPVCEDEDLLPLLTTPHNQNLSPLVESFGIPCFKVNNIEQFKESYLCSLKNENSTVIEVMINNQKNVEIYKKLKTVKL